MPYMQIFLTQGHIATNFQCLEGLPEGAVFESSYYDPETRACNLVFSHASFDEVTIGQEIPLVTPLVYCEGEKAKT